MVIIINNSSSIYGILFNLGIYLDFIIKNFLCSVSSMHVECILPFGMMGLSAWRMMFVKMVFSVCMSGGGKMSENAASVSYGS